MDSGKECSNTRHLVIYLRKLLDETFDISAVDLSIDGVTTRTSFADPRSAQGVFLPAFLARIDKISRAMLSETAPGSALGQSGGSFVVDGVSFAAPRVARVLQDDVDACLKLVFEEWDGDVLSIFTSGPFSAVTRPGLSSRETAELLEKLVLPLSNIQAFFDALSEDRLALYKNDFGNAVKGVSHSIGSFLSHYEELSELPNHRGLRPTSEHGTRAVLQALMEEDRKFHHKPH